MIQIAPTYVKYPDEVQVGQVSTFTHSTQVDSTSYMPLMLNGASILKKPDSSSNYQMARVQRLFQYLEKLRTDGDVSKSTAESAWRAWNHVSVGVKSIGQLLPVPDAAAGPNGELLYTWDKDEHHFELEFFADASPEQFYANRETGELWDAEYVSGEPITQAMAEKLLLII